jgi:hypothetical protein
MMYLWLSVIILVFAGYLLPALLLSGLGIYLEGAR